MSSKRVFFLMLGLMLAFLVIIIAGTYEVNGLLSKQSQQLTNAKAKDAALREEQTQLNSAKKEIATYNDLYNISKVVVPQNKNQTEAVRQIVNLATESGVTIASITFPASTLGSSAVPTPSSAATSGTALGTSAAVGGNPSLSQLTKVTNIPGVYVLQLVVSSSSDNSSLATYPQLISFLSKLEQNRLTSLVSNINIQPGSDSPSKLSFQLTLNIYIKPAL